MNWNESMMMGFFLNFLSLLYSRVSDLAWPPLSLCTMEVLAVIIIILLYVIRIDMYLVKWVSAYVMVTNSRSKKK